MKDITIGAIVGVITIFVLVYINDKNPVDDSDLNPEHRSGMKVFTDYKTGLQYLASPYGGIIQRMDVNGRQMSIHP